MSLMRPIMRPIMGPARRAITAPGFAGSSGLADGASIAFGDVMTVSTAPAWLNNTRSGSAYYRASGGAFSTAAANVARLHTMPDGSGLLSEPAASHNGSSGHERINNWVTTTYNSSISVGAAASPFGASTADLLSDDSSTGIGFAGRAEAFTSDATFTFWALVKADQLQYATALHGSMTKNPRQGFNLSSPAAYTPIDSNLDSAGVIDLGDGWVIIHQTVTSSPDSSGSVGLFANDAFDNGNPQVDLDGTSSIYVAWLQVEDGDTVTSPVAGGASRSADSMTIDCTHADLAIPDGDTVRFTATDGTTTSDVVVSSGSVSVPHSSWQAPWETITRIAA